MGPETDAARVGSSAEIDVGQLLHRDADLMALAVGEPQHPARRDRLLDGRPHGFGVSVVGQLDLDFPRVVGHTDADVHSCSSCGRTRHATRSAPGSYRGGMGAVRGDDASARAAAQSAEELDAIRRRVITVAAHPWPTPATTIAGMANALEASRDDTTTA